MWPNKSDINETKPYTSLWYYNIKWHVVDLKQTESFKPGSDQRFTMRLTHSLERFREKLQTSELVQLSSAQVGDVVRSGWFVT